MKETSINIKKVYQYGKKYKWVFILEAFCTIIQALIGIIIPLLLAKQIVLLTDNQFYQLILTSLGVLIISLVDILNFAIIAKTCNIFRRNTIKNIQIELGKEIVKITQSEIEKNGTGTFIERLNQDAHKMTELFTIGVGYISDFTINIGIFCAVFVINKFVFVYYVIVAIILTLLHLLKTKLIKKEDKILRKKKDSTSSLIGEMIRGIKDIKMLSAKNSFIHLLKEEINNKNKSYNKIRNVEIFFNVLIKSLTQIFSFLLILLLILLIKKEIISTAIAVALFTYKSNIMSDFMQSISLLLNEIKEFNISSNRVFAILDNKEFKKETFGLKQIKNLKGEFIFDHVTFSYDTLSILKDLSFKIESGQTIAFVGKSGAGKSTIFNLLGKLYTPQKGKILIDGENINNLDENSIRNHITLISQDPYIFNRSIKDNFLLIKEDITEKEIIEALKKASLYEFVMSLPDKLDTIIGEGGTNLSGGQKQRLAIARAFIGKTKTILFDESTSALDNETQKEIQKVIDNLKGEYTILIIAHRLSTIKNVDRILVIDQGKLIAEGTHQELLQKNKIYKQLYETEIIETNQ